MSAEKWRLPLAGFLAGLAAVVAVGPPRPRPRPRPALTVVPDLDDLDDLEPFDASDVLHAHGVTVA